MYVVKHVSSDFYAKEACLYAKQQMATHQNWNQDQMFKTGYSNKIRKHKEWATVTSQYCSQIRK
jgi:hypothetical protein